MLIILVIVFIIFISALFAAAETAITSVSEAKIISLSQKKNPRAAIIEKLKKNGGKLIGTILVANNALNLIVSSITASFVMKNFGEEVAIICSFVMAFIIILFAEVLPKTYAIHNAQGVSLFTAKLVSISVKFFSPITWFLNFCVDIIFKIFGVSIENNKKLTDAINEIKGTINHNHRDGFMNKPEKDMLASILDMYDRDVKDIMVHRTHIFSIDVDEDYQESINKILESGYTRIPVWKDNKENIVGILHIKNILKYFKKNHSIEDFDLNKILTKPWFIPETTKLKDQLMLFQNSRNHCAIVVDEYGAIQGLITLTDIVEEIVGRTYDEQDNSNEIRKIGQDKWEVSGVVTIREINRYADFDFPDDGVATIAGLLLQNMERIPAQNDFCIIQNVKLTVKEIKKNQILTMILEKI